MKNKLFALIFLALFVIALIFAVMVERSIKQSNIENDLRETSAIFTAKVTAVMEEFKNTVEILPSPAACNSQVFKSIVYKNKYIKNMGVMKDGVKQCDAYQAEIAQKKPTSFENVTTADGWELIYWYNGPFFTLANPEGYFLEFDFRHFFDFEVEPTISGFALINQEENAIWFKYFKHKLTEKQQLEIEQLIKRQTSQAARDEDKALVPQQEGSYFLLLSPALDYTMAGVFVDVRQIKTFELISIKTLLYGLLFGVLFSIIFYFLLKRSYSMKNMLARDIKNRKLFMVYQPLVDIDDEQKIVGFESLIRWRTESGDMIPPDIFIPIAEAHKMTRDLTHFIIERVFEELHPVFQKNPQMYVSLNVTPSDLHDEGMAKFLLHRLNHYQLSADNVVIELTERIVADKQALTGINILKKAGFKISIDDFGTGASNIKYLGELEPDVIKVDRAFVVWSEAEGPTSELLGQLIQLGKNFKLKVVVEGVETRAQADRCKAAGADIGQGYFWHKPLTMKDLNKHFPHLAA